MRTRVPDMAPRTSRLPPSFRHYSFDHPRSPNTDTSRVSRPPSIDYGFSGAPFEDLRRRLSAINGSGASLPATFSHRPPSMSVSSPAQPAGLTLGDLPEVSDRPGSPTDSVVSGPIPPLNLAMHRFHVGSGDSQKAAPAIGSSRANATGHLEPTSKMRPEGSPERSGRTSPASASGTILGQHWHRTSSLAPISTYGWHTALLINTIES